MSKFIRTPTFCIVLLGTVPGLECGLPPIGITDPPDRRAELVQPVQMPPLLIGLLGDKSISMEAARSTPIQGSDLVDIIALLRTGGGALALGFVGESTWLRLLRLKLRCRHKDQFDQLIRTLVSFHYRVQTPTLGKEDQLLIGC